MLQSSEKAMSTGSAGDRDDQGHPKARSTPPPVSGADAPLIRRATPDDAAALAELAARTFRDTYGGASTAADIDAYVTAHFGSEHQRAELVDVGMRTLIAVDADGALMGYAQLRLSPTAESPTPAAVVGGTPVELARFYVDRRWHGRGLAASLFAAIDDELAARPGGAMPLWLFAYQENARAVAFYRRQGFTVAGEATFWLGGERQQDWILTRNVPPRPRS